MIEGYDNDLDVSLDTRCPNCGWYGLPWAHTKDGCIASLKAKLAHADGTRAGLVEAHLRIAAKGVVCVLVAYGFHSPAIDDCIRIMERALSLTPSEAAAKWQRLVEAADELMQVAFDGPREPKVLGEYNQWKENVKERARQALRDVEKE